MSRQQINFFWAFHEQNLWTHVSQATCDMCNKPRMICVTNHTWSVSKTTHEACHNPFVICFTNCTWHVSQTAQLVSQTVHDVCNTSHEFFTCNLRSVTWDMLCCCLWHNARGLCHSHKRFVTCHTSKYNFFEFAENKDLWTKHFLQCFKPITPPLKQINYLNFVFNICGKVRHIVKLQKRGKYWII